MYQMKTCKAIVGFCVASITGISLLAAPFPAIAKLTGIELGVVPKVGSKGGPGGRSPGGSRVPICFINQQDKLYALSPGDGVTVEKHPTFFVHVPATKAKQGNFVLINERNQIVYRTTTDVNSNAINSISLSANTSAGLETGKRYKWVFSVACDPNAPDSNPYFDGFITRTELSSSLASQLAKSSLTQRLVLYINSGLWYDALLTAAELRRSTPENPTLKTTWTDLLDAVGLNEMSDKPLL